MKSLSRLLYSAVFILISLTYYSCKSSSYQTKAVSVESKETAAKKEVVAAKKEVTAAKKEEAAAKKEGTAVKKEEKATERSPEKVEDASNKELSAGKSVKTVGKTFNGGASYYADHFHGKKTASGELYDKEQYTAAIRTNALPFPFGTLVEVTSIKNGKSVVVKINDKMSDKAKGIIDLSYEAAKAIGLIQDGRTEVTVRKVSEGEQ